MAHIDRSLPGPKPDQKAQPPPVRTEGFFRAIRHDGGKWEICFKHVKSGVALTVIDNLPQDVCMQLKEQLNAIVYTNRGRVLLSPEKSEEPPNQEIV